MDNTIEKALQRQMEAKLAAEKKAQSDLTTKQTDKENSSGLNSIEQLMAAKAVAKVLPNEKDSANSDANSIVDETTTAEEPVPAEKDNAPVHAVDGNIAINLVELEQKGFVSINATRSRINEEYREIKRKLLKNAFGLLSSTIDRANIIMVTSARPSEGKTFTAVNLALSIAAEQDKTVLLVDADVLKPNVLRTLNVKAESGLMEYLIGEVNDISEVLYQTNIDKLKIIPAGRSHHLSTELLASKKMEETIREFSSRYADRVVIIDSPPMLGINESAVLAGFAGQAVMVVEEGKSKLNDIQKAVARLNPEMAIGFVVNKSTNSNSDDTGYYGYYYGSEQD
jgi:exopolysaccharide/PEP-CTERM locus tyrosine autokinase